jgi:hypothetical protein
MTHEGIVNSRQDYQLSHAKTRSIKTIMCSVMYLGEVRLVGFSENRKCCDLLSVWLTHRHATNTDHLTSVKLRTTCLLKHRNMEGSSNRQCNLDILCYYLTVIGPHLWLVTQNNLWHFSIVYVAISSKFNFINSDFSLFVYWEIDVFFVQFMNCRKESVRCTQYEDQTIFNAMAILKENRSQNF